MRRLRTLLGLCLLLALAGPSGAQSPAPRLVEESFRLDPGPLDFIRGEGLEQFMLQALAGDALVGLDVAGRPVPRLAATWTLRGHALRFRLRRDAVFTDGHPVRAEDAVWTFRTLQVTPEASPTKRAILANVSVRLEGGDVVLEGAKPAARLLIELARVPVAREGAPGVGSGPFAAVRAGTVWTLSARSHFLRPGIAGFRFRLLPDELGVFEALQKGWLHLGVPPHRRDLRPPPGYHEVRQVVHAQVVLWSRRREVLSWMQRWREDAFPQGFLGGAVRPSRGLWPETLGHPPMRLTAPLGDRPARLEVSYPALDEMVQKALMALRARAAKDGVTLELRPVETALFFAQLGERRFETACTVALFDPHPWSVLDFVEPQAPMNFTGWTHPRLAAWLSRLETPEAPAWRELQEAWAADPGALPLLDLTSILWVDDRLEVQPSPVGLYFTTPGPSGWRWLR
ncbi:MAG: ABC transporter substrate-binding protein [Holophagaceae bacterium]